MAAAIRSSTPRTIVVKTRSPTVAKTKYNQLASRAAATARRLRDASAEDTSAMVAVGSAVAVGLYEKSGSSLPTLFGIDPLIVWGTAGYFLTRGKSGETASAIHAAGLALVTIGANRSVARGSMRIGEDDGDGDGDFESEL